MLSLKKSQSPHSNSSQALTHFSNMSCTTNLQRQIALIIHLPDQLTQKEVLILKLHYKKNLQLPKRAKVTIFSISKCPIECKLAVQSSFQLAACLLGLEATMQLNIYIAPLQDICSTVCNATIAGLLLLWLHLGKGISKPPKTILIHE